MNSWIKSNPLAVLLGAGLVVLIGGLIAIGVMQSRPAGNSEVAVTQTGDPVVPTESFSYSDGIDENGFWIGLTAANYVTDFDPNTIVIPASVHQVSDEEMASSMQSFLAYVGAPVTEITDRAVVAGDQVNIDYVGSVDGVAFEGGSTDGMGTTVTAGGTGYIDDFLDQIIGRSPGETFDVLVTFPDEYPNSPDLAGKDAVFETTINYIAEPAPLTDEFVADNFSTIFGWTTVAEMEAAQREELQQAAIDEYLDNLLSNQIEVTSIPQALIDYQERSLIQYFQDYATSTGATLTDFLTTNMGVSTPEELLAMYREDIEANARRALVTQAIAEQAGIAVSQADLETFMPDYASLEEEYGLPFVKQYVLELKVLDFLRQNAQLG